MQNIAVGQDSDQSVEEEKQRRGKKNGARDVPDNKRKPTESQEKHKKFVVQQSIRGSVMPRQSNVNDSDEERKFSSECEEEKRA